MVRNGVVKSLPPTLKLKMSGYNDCVVMVVPVFKGNGYSQ